MSQLHHIRINIYSFSRPTQFYYRKRWVRIFKLLTFNMYALVFLWEQPYWIFQTYKENYISWLFLFFVCFLVILMIMYKSQKAFHVSHLGQYDPKQDCWEWKMIHEAIEARGDKKEVKPTTYLSIRITEMLESMQMVKISPNMIFRKK